MFDEDDGFVFRFHGVVTLDDVMVASREWYDRHDLDQYRYQIWDFGNVDRVDMDDFGARIVAVMDDMPYRLNKSQKLALIGNRDDVINLFKEYVLTLENDKIITRIFRDESEARKWIGV